METFRLGDFLMGENGFLIGFLHFTNNIHNFLFTEISLFGNTISVWQLFATASITVFVAIFLAKFIIS